MKTPPKIVDGLAHIDAIVARSVQAEHESAITHARYLQQVLEAGDQDAARGYGETLREILANASSKQRGLMVAELASWIEVHANGHASVMREIIGLGQPETPTIDTVADERLNELVQAAAANSDKLGRLAQIERVFRMLAELPALQARGWRGECVRQLGISKREFDEYLRDARRDVERSEAYRASLEERPDVPTHDELADRWKERHPQTKYALGEWRRYELGHWPATSPDTIQGEIKAVVVGAKKDGIRPTANMVNSVTALAKLDVFEPDGGWDADPDLLVMTNGTLQLSARELRAHNPEDRITTALGFAYDPEAECPTWRAFLAAIVPDASDFLQEFAGYAITTDTRHEVAVWLYGPPGSGKSTFVEGLRAMLGKRAGQLGLADIERSSFALSNLPGKTLMVATEQPADFIRSGHILNSIISGEAVNVDRKFREMVTITPRAKLCWALNDLPRIAEAGSGLFRRVKVVAFPPLAESARDPGVKEAIMAEGAGILNWAIEGLQRLNARGRFEIPACVKTATDDFRAKNDVPALFIAECCTIGTEERVRPNELYAAYKTWCDTNGHRAKSSTAIADDWARLGFTRYKPGGVTYWRGVRIADLMA